MALGDYAKTAYVNGSAPAISAANLNNNENKTDELDTAVESHLVDYTVQVPYGATTGAANTYVLATPAIAALTEGMAVCVKINVDSTGASTLNWDGKGAKGIKKANGADATNLKNGGIYTLRYNGTNFIVQGEGASGDAAASDLLSGKKASVDAGDITGTMPNKVGSTTVFTPGTTDQAITQGYYSGAVGDGKVLGDADLVAAKIKSGTAIFGINGTVVEAAGDAVVADVLAGKVFSKAGSAGLTGTMVDRGTVNITPSTGNQAITAGKHSGSGVVYGDADLVAANIKSGANIFGVAGSFDGKRWASGSGVTTYASSCDHAVVTGLAFTPALVVVEFQISSVWWRHTFLTASHNTDINGVEKKVLGVAACYVSYGGTVYSGGFDMILQTAVATGTIFYYWCYE